MFQYFSKKNQHFILPFFNLQAAGGGGQPTCLEMEAHQRVTPTNSRARLETAPWPAAAAMAGSGGTWARTGLGDGVAHRW
jgi:hypothetical protein